MNSKPENILRNLRPCCTADSGAKFVSSRLSGGPGGIGSALTDYSRAGAAQPGPQLGQLVWPGQVAQGLGHIEPNGLVGIVQVLRGLKAF